MTDEKLLEMTVKLASSQVITNTIALSHLQNSNPAMVNEVSMVRLVGRYYRELKNNFPAISQ